MNTLKVKLKNCYGIQSLEEDFQFPSSAKSKAYAIYAPNGLMKTSFTRTFEALAKGESPKEERYNHPSTCLIEVDGKQIPKEMIYVLKSEIDISADSPAMTNILVDPENKAKYDSLIVNLNKSKDKLINALQKRSKVSKKDVENFILSDWGKMDFPVCIKEISQSTLQGDLGVYEYAIIFDPKAVEVLKSPEFISSAIEFNNRYQELFEQAGTIYQKGIFNPTKAETSFSTLDKQGFFKGGHRVHLRGDTTSIDKAELDNKLQVIHASLDGDAKLKKLRANLAKNAQTQALLTDLLEKLSATQIEFLLDSVKLENQTQFRKELWCYYIQNTEETTAYLSAYDASKDEIESIETAAAQIAPRWVEAVELFNDRFVDMPFTLKVANQVEAALGKKEAKLKFVFKDAVSGDIVECSREEIKALSQGEKRALYLLNFIFDVEAKKLAAQETLFIIDDVADSFDYKNKHAIVQYLKDLSYTPTFHQVILTHNYDFFRTLATNVVDRERCYMANREHDGIRLTKAEGVNNYFTGVWKQKVGKNERVLCATIPFTRNLLEYTKGTQDPDYLKLTSLLHYKSDTEQITVNDYLDIYNRLFGTSHTSSNVQSIKSLLFAKANEICNATSHNGLNLEDKVLLSIATRMQAEIFLVNEFRRTKKDPNYCHPQKSTFGKLIEEYRPVASKEKLRTLEKVNITVSSNIHLNSFMYEPILDLTIEHLVSLFNEVQKL